MSHECSMNASKHTVSQGDSEKLFLNINIELAQFREIKLGKRVLRSGKVRENGQKIREIPESEGEDMEFCLILHIEPPPDLACYT